MSKACLELDQLVPLDSRDREEMWESLDHWDLMAQLDNKDSVAHLDSLVHKDQLVVQDQLAVQDHKDLGENQVCVVKPESLETLVHLVVRVREVNQDRQDPLEQQDQ